MDTNNIITCKCGILLDKTIVLKLSKDDCGHNTHCYEGKCPVCKDEIYREW